MNTENNDTTDNTPTPDEGIPTDRRPIGFWLRAVDGLISAEFATAFEAEGITRRDWMLLNSLSGDVDAPWLTERLARKGKRLGNLVDRGWIAEVDGTWTLTDEGRAAKARLGEIVDGIRSRVSGAVSPDDFATTMASLEAIARELGWEEGQRMPRSGRGRFGRPGFGRPAFGPRPDWSGAGFGPDGDTHRGFGRGHRGFGPGHRSFGPEHGADAPCDGPHHPHGHHGHPHHEHAGHQHRGHEHSGHAAHPQRGHGRGAQRAYERGFDAGFSRGQTGQASPAGPTASDAA